MRELLELCSRLHSTRLAWERPLWEATVIEGLRDGRVAMYTKTHHALVDGVSAMRLVASVLSTDPDQRGMPAPWGVQPERSKRAREHGSRPSGGSRTCRSRRCAARSASPRRRPASPAPWSDARQVAAQRDLRRSRCYAPRTMFNQSITGSRRFAAQDWPIERLRAIGKATGTTINDVVIAMCSGALRSYLLEQQALPEQSLVAMVPVGLKAKQSHLASAEGGNAVGAVMVQMGTERADPADRLQRRPPLDDRRQARRCRR